jgi:hypothetical protein
MHSPCNHRANTLVQTTLQSLFTKVYAARRHKQRRVPGASSSPESTSMDKKDRMGISGVYRDRQRLSSMPQRST